MSVSGRAPRRKSIRRAPLGGCALDLGAKPLLPFPHSSTHSKRCDAPHGGWRGLWSYRGGLIGQKNATRAISRAVSTLVARRGRYRTDPTKTTNPNMGLGWVGGELGGGLTKAIPPARKVQQLAATTHRSTG